MALQPLKLTTLHAVYDGVLEKMVDNAMTKVYVDLQDRKTLDKARKVTLTMEFKPKIAADQGQVYLSEVLSKFNVKTNLPDQSFDITALPCAEDGTIEFNALMPRNPRQNTLPLDSETEHDEQ